MSNNTKSLETLEMRLVLGGNFIPPPYSMISGQGEAMSREWLFIKGKTRHWLIQPNREAEMILCWSDTKGKSQGFGGATLKMKVIGELHPAKWMEIQYKEPKIFEWQGPWSSNTQSLFEDTGYDIRNRIKTWGCLGFKRGRSPNSHHSTIEDLIYFDPAPQYGSYSRIKDLAKTISEGLQRPIAYYDETHGGSSSGTEGWREYSQNRLRSLIDGNKDDINRAKAAGREPWSGTLRYLKEHQEALAALIELQGGERDF